LKLGSVRFLLLELDRVLDPVFLLFSFFGGFFVVFAVSKFLQYPLHDGFFAESGDQLVARFAFLLLDDKH